MQQLIDDNVVNFGRDPQGEGWHIEAAELFQMPTPEF